MLNIAEKDHAYACACIGRVILKNGSLKPLYSILSVVLSKCAAAIVSSSCAIRWVALGLGDEQDGDHRWRVAVREQST